MTKQVVNSIINQIILKSRQEENNFLNTNWLLFQMSSYNSDCKIK